MVVLYDSTRSIKKKRSSIIKLLIDHTKEFCDKTTIHGLRYVTENGANWFQSLLWISFVISGGVFCSILMYLVWIRFNTNPTITAVETINYPIWNVPFPAVTICNVNKVQNSRTVNIKNLLLSNNVTEETANNFFKTLSNLVINQKPANNFLDVYKILKNKGYSVDKLMLEVMQPCGDFLKRCTWMGTIVKCMDYFKTIKTDEGYCCSFNYHHTNDTLDGVEDNKPTDIKNNKIYVAGVGFHTGLSIILDVQEEEYVSQTRTIPSALVHIHDSVDFPEMRILGMLIEKGELVQMPIDPSIIDTNNDVKLLHRSKRNCVFPEEVSLSIGSYGYENCIIECRMNAIIDTCGCIPFYYNVKNYKYRPKLKFCEHSEMKCLSDNHHLYISVLIPSIRGLKFRSTTISVSKKPSRIENTTYDTPSNEFFIYDGGSKSSFYTLRSTESSNINNSNIGLNCNCYSTCDVNWYTYTLDIGHMAENFEGFQPKNYIIMHTYFAEFSCIKYKQSNLITWDGLFASFGGIFGLCLGGSILSLVEIFYHFTIKFYLSYKARNNKVVKVQEANKQIVDARNWKNTLTFNDDNLHSKKYPSINGLVLYPSTLNNDMYQFNRINRKHDLHK